MLSLPFCNGSQPVPDQESTSGGIREPRRNALPLGFGCVEYLRVDIGIHGHGKLYGWIPSRHAKPYYRSGMVATRQPALGHPR